ncbi:aldo-keto reductase family 1 member D1 [Octopus bimaculoides]|uniref:aldo-keto reductase family 1 member D1 n=1 Tax=Octopus bimaculoides TaxID=37653 RepID=UPI00071D2C8A|nr:aldo-keto reductase family 1 member D1 [Octopus bimaculoides]|eukprot:XP_014788932.1 PREDICTED: 3-oxo-5-beta-steroid 4-dehydrogenase-like [Octopus bimaculoides]
MDGLVPDLHHKKKKLQKFCLERNIFLTAFALLGSPGRVHTFFEGCNTDLEVLRNDTLKIVGKKYKIAAQIMLRNLIQRGIRVISKSSNPDRIKDNFNVFNFHFSPEDMASIGEEKVVLRYFTFSKSAPNIAKHPEYPFNIPY